VHHPIRHVAVVSKEEETLGVAVESAHGIDPFSDVDQFHHGAATSFVVGRGDVAARLVQQDVPVDLGA